MDAFAVTAPGLEPVCAAELSALGIAGAAVDGGVTWRGDLASLYRANLWSRTASRVVVRAGEFRARTFGELERHAARLPWARLVGEGAQVSLRVTSRKSRLYHSDAVAERVAGVLAREVRADAGVLKQDDEEGGEVAAQLVVIRFVRDVCTVSVDSSGALLHQRGYRQALAKAPLRETLAAALLLASGWHGRSPLIDPLCGAGTLAIEAALLARRIAPGLAAASREPRAYAFQAWPGYDGALWRSVVADAQSLILPGGQVPILGSDRNAGAITAARSNAERAGVAADMQLVQCPLADVEAPEAAATAGHIATNPPYGVRVGQAGELHGLYRTLGRVAAERFPGWTLALIAAEPRLSAATGLPLLELLATRNGGIAIRMLAGRTPARTTTP